MRRAIVEACHMSDIEVARQSAKASAILFVGNLTSTAILAVALIIVARLLGPDQYGAYTLVFLIPSALQLVAGFGVNFAVARQAAYHSAKGDLQSARRITLHAVIFLLIIGLLMASANYLGAGFTASTLLKRPELAQYVREASLFIVGQTMFAGAVSALIGWNAVVLSATSSIAQAGMKLAISVTLVVLGFGVFGAVSGQALSYVLGGALAVGMLLFTQVRGYKPEHRLFVSDVRMMASYGLPLFLGNVTSGLSAQYVSVILAVIASNAFVGYFQAAANATVLITVTLTAIDSSLFQAFSRLDGMKGNLPFALRLSVKYASFVVAPLIAFIIATAGPLLSLVYGGSYVDGAAYLQLFAISYLPSILGLNIMAQFFNGAGRTRFTMLVLISGATTIAFSAPLFTFILDLGISGLLYANILGNVVGAVAGLAISRRYMGAKIDLRGAAVISLASAAAYLVIVGIDGLVAPKLLVLLLDGVVFAVVYLTAAPLLGALRVADLERLNTASEAFGRVSAPFKAIIRYEGAVLKLVDRERPPRSTQPS